MICKVILIINCTLFPWNDHDDKVIERAVKVCKDKYGPSSPCVSKVIKRGERDYRVLCGAAERREENDRDIKVLPKEADPETRARECSKGAGAP